MVNITLYKYFITITRIIHHQVAHKLTHKHFLELIYNSIDNRAVNLQLQ
jgi:hypothetical protein